MKRLDRDTYALSSGRRFGANIGSIGITSEGGVFEITTGYDEGVDLEPDPSIGIAWTAAERVELAQFMIDQWIAFKAEAVGG